ncbi:MAG: L-threonylcarbamoyladenylate synthase [Myxococcota bacterium]|nr:L-threonylcarbamoyladenylate synthase [Myxococcota bacterium]
MASIAEAAALDVLAEDGLVAFPTETVWGLAARAESSAAIDRLRAFKGREPDKSFSILVDSPERGADVAAEWSEAARKLSALYWPGPLTLVVNCAQRFAPGVVSADGSIGLRCSPHPVAAVLAEGALDRGLGPVTATSLNRAGDPPARNRVEAEIVCGDEIPMVDGEAGGAAASTVVDARSACLRVLREGAIPRDALEAR